MNRVLIHEKIYFHPKTRGIPAHLLEHRGISTFGASSFHVECSIPLAKPFLEYLKKTFAPRADAPIFPEKGEADGESRRLSAQFHALLVKAELVDARPKDKNSGKGHSVKRTVSELSFHSLRHNTTSWLKKAAVPESVVRDIIGHESELVSRNYTHVDDATKREAIRKLPRFAVTA